MKKPDLKEAFSRFDSRKHKSTVTAIKQVPGHADIRTTLKYAHNDFESQRVVFQNPTKNVEIINLKK